MYVRPVIACINNLEILDSPLHPRAIGIEPRWLIRMLSGIVPRNVLPCRVPHVIKLTHVLYNLLEDLETSRSAHPPGVDGDGDICRSACQAFFTDCSERE